MRPFSTLHPEPTHFQHAQHQSQRRSGHAMRCTKDSWRRNVSLCVSDALRGVLLSHGDLAQRVRLSNHKHMILVRSSFEATLFAHRLCSIVDPCPSALPYAQQTNSGVGGVHIHSVELQFAAVPFHHPVYLHRYLQIFAMLPPSSI